MRNRCYALFRRAKIQSYISAIYGHDSQFQRTSTPGEQDRNPKRNTIKPDVGEDRHGDGGGRLEEEFDLADYVWEEWALAFTAWCSMPTFTARAEVLAWSNDAPPSVSIFENQTCKKWR